MLRTRPEDRISSDEILKLPIFESLIKNDQTFKYSINDENTMISNYLFNCKDNITREVPRVIEEYNTSLQFSETRNETNETRSEDNRIEERNSVLKEKEVSDFYDLEKSPSIDLVSQEPLNVNSELNKIFSKESKIDVCNDFLNSDRNKTKKVYKINIDENNTVLKTSSERTIIHENLMKPETVPVQRKTYYLKPSEQTDDFFNIRSTSLNQLKYKRSFFNEKPAISKESEEKIKNMINEKGYAWFVNQRSEDNKFGTVSPKIVRIQRTVSYHCNI